jgi:NDP-sugar pyrophosphorylase family protein
MEKPALVIMAAGLGSRYGGLKQIDPVGPCGEKIIDYSVFDAIEAGFNKVIFIIKEELLAEFKEVIGNYTQKEIEVSYAFQKIDAMPNGYDVPENRVKPWGTAHAVLSCKGIIDGPFAVINADDYYGKEAFTLLYEYLIKPQKSEQYSFCMVGYGIEKTLTENGYVARGVCKTNSEGILTDIVERTHIEKRDNKIEFTEDGQNWTEISPNSTVSMNCWGFSKDILAEIETRFIKFLDSNKENLKKAEYFLPFVVGELIEENRAKVKVLKTSEKWYGVTYPEDKENVVREIAKMIRDEKYPERLWGIE